MSSNSDHERRYIRQTMLAEVGEAEITGRGAVLTVMLPVATHPAASLAVTV